MAKKTQQNELTEMVFILDRSGSMCGLESDTIGGFNSLIEKQKKQSGACFVTTVLFSDTIETIHDRCKLEAVKKMTDKDYRTIGCTALYDAIGNTIAHITSIHKYARKEDVPAHTIVVIITDGYENASREYSHTAVKKLIEQKKEASGWEFLFIGANIDAAATAQDIGIGRDRAANYKADKAGTAVVFEALSAPLCACRASKTLDSSWNEAIEEDCKKR